MNREQAMTKVAKLLNLAAGAGTEDEATAAAGQAQKLMDKWRIEASMLAEASTEDVDPDEPIVDFVNKGGDEAALGVMGKQYVEWKYRLASRIATANGCRTYYARRGYGRARRVIIGIVGRPSDADTVRYFYNWLLKEIDRIAIKEARGMGRVWGRNFRLGMVDRVGERLSAAKKAAQQDMYAEAKARDDASAAAGSVPRESALVIVDRALERMKNRDTELSQWVKDNMRLRSVSRRASVYDHTAREAGRAVGDRMNLGGKARAGLTAGHKALK
jgi:hypothetical protein